LSAVACGFSGDSGVVAGECERLVGDLQGEVFGHVLNLLITLPTRSAIMSCPRSGRLSRRVGAPRVHMLPNPFHHNSRSLFSFVGNSVRLGFHLAS
jgi:hypothetical protein